MRPLNKFKGIKNSSSMQKMNTAMHASQVFVSVWVNIYMKNSKAISINTIEIGIENNPEKEAI